MLAYHNIVPDDAPPVGDLANHLPLSQFAEQLAQLRRPPAAFDTLPQDLSVIKTYNKVQAAFPGGPIPALVAVSADDVTTPEVSGAVKDLQKQAAASPSFGQPITTLHQPRSHGRGGRHPPGRRRQRLEVESSADRASRSIWFPPPSGRSRRPRPTSVASPPIRQDFNETLKSHVFLVFAFVLSAAFLLLLVTFRSIVIPIKAIVLNLLSVGAAYGVLVWIFQEGHLESLLGFQSNGAIVAWMPLFLFVVLFGLSMDYHVFILTRIREAYDRGRSTEDAVTHGIKTTAGVVTSAAVVMISVFAIFATLSLLIFKQLGVGLAVAVLIDATIIRGVLLPATMKLLGDWNWYLPKWLEWIPRVGPARGTDLPPAPEAPASGSKTGPEPIRP